MTTATADLGLIGLAVMGQNLVLNMNDNDFVISVFNRTVSKVDDFMAGGAAGTNIVPTHSIEEFVATLKRPRRVMLLVKAGAPVDAFIDMVLPHLEEGDIIIDGGNSNFHDTIRRCDYVESKGMLYVGTGVSGGEEGARRGPSIMPGGSEAAWPAVKDIFQAVSAKADSGEACCDWVGRGGAGHFVKMVHNGIEYGDMQLICEAYQLMTAAGISPAEQSEIFGTWNEGVLDSYLIEITRDILAKTDDETGKPMVDVILDTAGQKGTGKWTGITALDLGMPLTLIGEAVFARCLSAMKDQRVAAAGPLAVELPALDAADKAAFVEDIRQALYASKIVSYAQGYQLMREASNENDWGLNYGGIALMWRGGCIIRSAFLTKIREAFVANPELDNLLLDEYFRGEMASCQSGWRTTIAKAIASGIPTPAFASALAYFDGYRSERLPANLLQAQRDYFGCHTYERIDKPRGEFFHTKWIEGAGDTTASTYDV
ncbi:MAG: decarboxylating NADP(+)-dependent phosphogluconate dehydrogenase [Phycisphaerales bacterium]|jgi:6-phosphogluconate dehydrogenase|nr:decarboxylating NADP(+)-dependent phosphogluconate dehydrogenase [Phycisphaerales bacterium]MBT7171057.1 decarboxylating NADP(+)-dependent phosphogluconate dehydrogenase [Phycisphaerales bacterium]